MSYAFICSAVQDQCVNDHPNDLNAQSNCNLSFTLCSISASADYAASTILAGPTTAADPATVTVTPTADPITSITNNATPTSSSSSAAATQHLSTGAKAGIGVGVGIAGLLLVLIVAVVLIRRRRIQNARQLYGHDATSALNNEKSTAFSEVGERREVH